MNGTSDSFSYGTEGGFISTLDAFPEASRMSVYCSCGRIVLLDRSEMNTRLRLGKELECVACRNARISHEIEEMDDHFSGMDGADSVVCRTGLEKPLVRKSNFCYERLSSY